MLLGMIPKVLELRNERLEDFEDLVSEDVDDEEEKIGEGRIDLVQEEEDIVALFFVLLRKGLWQLGC